jgi:hypothetical protein
MEELPVLYPEVYIAPPTYINFFKPYSVHLVDSPNKIEKKTVKYNMDHRHSSLLDGNNKYQLYHLNSKFLKN